MSEEATELSPEQAKKEILELEHALDVARAAGDTQAFERVLAPGFVTTNAAGVLQSKAEMLADTATGRMRMTASKVRDVRIEVSGMTAIVTGVASIRGRYRRVNIAGDYAYTHVYQRMHDGWQVLAAQNTRIAPDAYYAAYSTLANLLRIRKRR